MEEYIPRRRRKPKWKLNWLYAIMAIIITLTASVLLGDFIGKHLLSFNNSSSDVYNIPDEPKAFYSPQIDSAYQPEASMYSPTLSSSSDTSPSLNIDTLPVLILPPPVKDTSGKVLIVKEKPRDASDSSSNTTLDTTLDSNDSSSYIEKIESSFIIQVGFFVSKENALKLSSKLIEDGYKAQIEELPRDDSFYYRVKIGDYYEELEAKALAEELKAKGYSVFVLSR